MDKRQRSIFWHTGGAAFVIWSILTLAAVFAELWVGSRALVVSYNGKLYFPVVQGQISGKTFGLNYDYETDYRELKNKFDADAHPLTPSTMEGENNRGPAGLNRAGPSPAPHGIPEVLSKTPSISRNSEKDEGRDNIITPTAKNIAAPQNFILLPLIPYSPTENALATHSPNAWAPSPPDFAHKHFLGTDPLGRDILSRLVYGYRNALIFSSLYLVGLMIIGTILGIAFGYYGGAFDFIGQRLIEIWSNIPLIYVVMIVASITAPSLLWLVVLSLIFGWTGVAAFVRTLAFREKTRDFVQAAKAAGASDFRVIVRHILPQMGSLLLTFLPFQAVGAITTLTSLDFLGFGLRPPAASWGEMLRTGSSSLQAPWIVSSVVVAMALILILLTIIGNALREAFDPKTLLRYK